MTGLQHAAIIMAVVVALMAYSVSAVNGAGITANNQGNLRGEELRERLVILAPAETIQQG